MCTLDIIILLSGVAYLAYRAFINWLGSQAFTVSSKQKEETQNEQRT